MPDFLSLVWDAELLQLMLLACPDGVVVVDNAGRVILYTGASEQIFGYSPIEVLNHDARMLFGESEVFDLLLERLKVESTVSNLEMPGRNKDSGHFIASVSSALCQDRWGAVIGLVLYIRDHSTVRAIEHALRDNNQRLNELVSELNHVASHDALTGLLNRASAVQAAERAVTRGSEVRSLGVVVFDADHFKSVNDNHGHLIGDDVLRALSGVLRSVARSGDIVGRFGGEEFVAFLPGADLAAASRFAERVREAVEGLSVSAGGGRSVRITVSAGVASMPESTDALNDAIRIADDRLYHAKHGGRNRIVSSDPAPQRNAA